MSFHVYYYVQIMQPNITGQITTTYANLYVKPLLPLSHKQAPNHLMTVMDPHCSPAIVCDSITWNLLSLLPSHCQSAHSYFSGLGCFQSLPCWGGGRDHSLPSALLGVGGEHTSRLCNCRGVAVDPTSLGWQAEPSPSQWAHMLTTRFGKDRFN